MTATTTYEPQERRLLDDLPSGLFVGGSWRPAEGGSEFVVEDPATGAGLARVADASAADAMAALDAAVAAQRSWAATPARERSDVLMRAFALVRERADDFALLMTLEMGKPLAEARGEVAYGSEFLRWFAEEGPRAAGRRLPSPDGHGAITVKRLPVGPCLLITPWNFPLAMATRKVAPALAAGCTAVLKPAELTPLTTLLLVRVLEEAGLPPGVLNVVTTTSGPEVCAPVISDPRLRKLSFTGSTPVGRGLLRQAADGVLRSSMELGGNAPFLVFDDADLEAAVDGAMVAKFRNSGEACTAANRFLVQEGIAGAFVERVTDRVRGLRVGRGTEPGVGVGPLIDRRAVFRMEALVADAVRRGARVRCGGTSLPGEGTFFAPTVLTEVAPGSRVLTEEIFGPLLAVSTFADEAEAVHRANDTEFGLVAYAYTRDLARAARLTEDLDTGMTGINVGAVSNAAAPFGGVKQSGLGREGGHEGLAEYQETRYVLEAAEPR